MVGTMRTGTSRNNHTKARRSLSAFAESGLCLRVRQAGDDRNQLLYTSRNIRLSGGRPTLLALQRFPRTRSAFVCGQQFVNAVFEWLKMGIDDRRYRCRIDIAQVVVHENIAKATDLAPRYALTACLQGFRQVLCCLREGL